MRSRDRIRLLPRHSFRATGNTNRKHASRCNLSRTGAVNALVKAVARNTHGERGEEMKNLMLVAAVALTPLMAKDNEPARRLDSAAAVFSEVMAAPDKGIPQDMLEHAHCIVIVPELKTAAFIVGGKYGKGILSCRNKVGPGWSAPGTVRIEGGSVGFQIGGSSTDLIMLVMNERGADKLLSSKFTLGAE